MTPAVEGSDVYAAARCLAALAQDRQLRRATLYVSPKVVVKATRQRPFDARFRGETHIVTVGPPNWRERQFIAVCKRAYRRFPVRKVQFTYWPKRRGV